MTLYYTAGYAARCLRVSTATLRLWADRGLIDCEKTAGGHRRYDIASVKVSRVTKDKLPPQYSTNLAAE